MESLIDDQEISRARHDLRTVVNHLEGYVLLLREEEDPWVREPEIMDAFDQIDEASREILQILDRSRSRRRGQTPAQLLAQIQAYLEPAAGTVEAALIALSRTDGPCGHRDVQRLEQASTRLRQFISTGQVLPDRRPANRGETSVGVTNPRVLVIEDDEGNRELLDRMLTRFSYDVVGAANGAEALRVLTAGSFDVILLDLMLPDIDGLTLLQRIRDRAPITPVIVISALNEIDSIVRCIEAGAEDYFAKPFIPALLRTRVASAIDRKRYRELLAQAAVLRS